MYGTAQILPNAFCAATVTPRPPHNEVSRPRTSAVTFPVSAWVFSWSPGKCPSTVFWMSSYTWLFACSTNPRIVVNTSSSGKIEKNA